MDENDSAFHANVARGAMGKIIPGYLTAEQKLQYAQVHATLALAEATRENTLAIYATTQDLILEDRSKG